MAEGKIELSSLVPWHEGCSESGCLERRYDVPQVWRLDGNENVSKPTSFSFTPTTFEAPLDDIRMRILSSKGASKAVL